MVNNIKIGPAGWSYSDWKGIVYPSSRPAGFHEAEYLAQYFPTIEINTSFYRPLRPEVSRLWAQKLHGIRDFRFTAKLYRGFTHERRLDRQTLREYCHGLEPLIDAGRLGAVLMQFPWSFKRTKENLAYVMRVRRSFAGYPLVAEMRHASWNSSDALNAFEDNDLGFCNIDQPQLNQCLAPTAHVTSKVAYVRFHGRNYERWFDSNEDGSGRSAVQARYDYLYSSRQLEKWTGRIQRLAKQAQTVYVVTNNHFEGKAVVNALQLLSMLHEDTIESPPTLIEHYPELSAVSSNLPRQKSLFFDMPAIPPVYTAAVYARA